MLVLINPIAGIVGLLAGGLTLILGQSIGELVNPPLSLALLLLVVF